MVMDITMRHRVRRRRNNRHFNLEVTDKISYDQNLGNRGFFIKTEIIHHLLTD